MMATHPAIRVQPQAGTGPDVAEYAERLGISVEEAARVMAQKAADSSALSFMPGPKDVASKEAYNSWVRAKIQEALDDPRPPLSQEEAAAHFAKRRAKVLASAKK